MKKVILLAPSLWERGLGVRLLFIFIIFSFTLSAQTKVPTMAKLIQLYADSNMVAINDYAHQLGFKGEPFGINQVGNTYDYMVYTFAQKDTTKSKDYFTYTYGYHYPISPQGLTSINYGTNDKTVFDALLKELLGLGATEHFYKDGDPYYHLYQYKGLNISTYQNNHENAAKYNIYIGGR
jgi:hypothetical protein